MVWPNTDGQESVVNVWNTGLVMYFIQYWEKKRKIIERKE